MTSFVLVHGAWYGSWCWKRVRTLLQAKGHDVYTPTLTGIGERSHLLSPNVTLETHILDVANLIRWEDLSDVVLCGHSYGGCVITGVADRFPDRIRSLVYLDAFVLEDGENLMQHLSDEQRDQLLETTETSGGGGWRVAPIPAEVHEVNVKDRAWVNSHCTTQPLDTFEQRLPLTGGIRKINKVTYVLATGFRHGSPFPPFYEKAKAKGWTTLTIDCGHVVMLDKPEELTNLLLDAV